MKVTTNHVQPPIPIRDYDWNAYDSDSYDGAPDAGAQIVGWGRTEAEALQDFHTKWGDEHDLCEHGVKPSEKCDVCDTH